MYSSNLQNNGDVHFSGIQSYQSIEVFNVEVTRLWKSICFTSATSEDL